MHICCKCLTLCLTLWTRRRGRPDGFLQSDASRSPKVQLAAGRNNHAISSHNWYDALLPYARHWKRSDPLILSDKAADYHNTYHVRQRLISPHLSSATLVFLLLRCWDNDPRCFVGFLISGETTMTANYHLKDWAALRKSSSRRHSAAKMVACVCLALFGWMLLILPLDGDGPKVEGKPFREPWGEKRQGWKERRWLWGRTSSRASSVVFSAATTHSFAGETLATPDQTAAPLS